MGVEPASLCLGDLRRGGGRPPGADGGARRLAADHGFARGTFGEDCPGGVAERSNAAVLKTELLRPHSSTAVRRGVIHWSLRAPASVRMPCRPPARQQLRQHANGRGSTTAAFLICRRLRARLALVAPQASPPRSRRRVPRSRSSRYRSSVQARARPSRAYLLPSTKDDHAPRAELIVGAKGTVSARAHARGGGGRPTQHAPAIASRRRR